jgi:hypothetical protein
VLVKLDGTVRPRTTSGLASGAYRGGLPIEMPPIELVPISIDEAKLERDYDRIVKLRTSGLGTKRTESGNRRFTRRTPGRIAGAAGSSAVNWETPALLEGTHTLLGFVDDIGISGAQQSPYRDAIGVNLTDPARRAALPYKHLTFRDVLSEDIQNLDLAQVAEIRPLETDAVPESHLMRYLTYRLAAAILPQAGRVSDTSGPLLTVGLGLKSGLAMSDRLTVHKPGRDDRLEFELGIREVRDDWSRATFDPAEFLFVERYDPARGDIVYRRPTRPLALAFATPKVDASGYNPPPEMRDLHQKLETWCQGLSSKLRSSLMNLNVPVVDGDTATHRVEVTLFPPDVGNWDCDATIKFIDTQSNAVAANLDVGINESQALHWKP